MDIPYGAAAAAGGGALELQGASAAVAASASWYTGYPVVPGWQDI